MLIYCDSVILIYHLEFTGPLHARAVARLSALRAGGDEIAVSELTRLECRVKPIRLGDAAALAQWDHFFAQPDVRLVPITPACFERATQIRAAYNFKTPDALHLAAAVESGCNIFLTNDTRLSRYPDITVEVLP